MQIHNKKIANFDNSYISLPDDFYQHINPVPVKSPKLIIFNKNLGKNIGIDTNQSEECCAQLFSGNIVPQLDFYFTWTFFSWTFDWNLYIFLLDF